MIQEVNFAEVSMDAESKVTMDVDLEKASKYGNGVYTLDFKVREFLNLTDTV